MPRARRSYDDGSGPRVGDEHRGTVEVLRSYYAGETFNVLNVRELGGRKLNVVGGKVLHGILPGTRMEIQGTWVRSKYGMQIDVHHVNILSFDPNTGFVESLLSHCVKEERERLDPVLRDIVRIHGDGARDVILTGGYGRTTEERICARRLADVLGIKEQKDRRMAMLARLHRLGLSGPVAERMWTAFWDDAVDVLEAFPHEVALEIPGIPFAVADRIAFTHGLNYDPFVRVKTVVRHACDLAAENGHCFVDRDLLVEGVLRILAASPTTGIPEDSDPRSYVQRAISSSEGSGIVVIDQSRRVYPYACDEAEEVIARNVAVRMSSKSRGRTGLKADHGRLVDLVTVGSPIEYSHEQVAAIRAALDHPISIITGGPGTGKTTVCRAIVRCFESAGLRVALCSPTGRGAKRLQESVERDASTIHRLLEYRPDDGTWGRNCLDQVGAGATIVDEVSMVDVHLLRALLDAMPGVARVVLVGDSDQLPSIGPGRVLWDMMDSGCVPTTVLSTIFRQSSDNDLVPVSHAVRNGVSPTIPPLSRPVSVESGCWMVESPDPISARDSIHGLMLEVGESMGIDPGDVQVLTPMRVGPLGTITLNLVLQDLLNPPREGDRECRWGGSTFRIGDKVMQTRNDAHAEVYNGDMGVVVEIARSGIAIDFQGIGEVGYAGSQLESIEHCWAVTIHKCIAGDSLLLSESGLMTIEEVCGLDMECGRLRDIDRKLMTMDGIKVATQAFRGPPEPSIRIETTRGYSIEGSHRHPILVWDPDRCEAFFKKLPDVEVGDISVIQRDQGVFASGYVFVDYVPHRDGNWHRRKNLDNHPSCIDESVGELMGYLVGDGSYAKNDGYDIALTTADDQVSNRFGDLVSSLFGGRIEINSATADKMAKTWYYIDATCREWLLVAGLDYLSCRRKVVPAPIMSSPRSVQAAFLRGLFDADGSARGNGTRVVLSTASASVATQVHIMLLNFGIVSRRIPVESTNSYRVELYGGEVVKFRNRIGFGIDDKRADLDDVCRRSSSSGGKTNIDHIPGAASLLMALKRDVVAKLGDRWRVEWGRLVPRRTYRMLADLTSGRISNVTYAHLNDVLEAVSSAWGWVGDLESFRVLDGIRQSHFFFDPIVRVSEGECSMYDVAVPDGENFFSNGFISHNSQGSEFDAGIVVMHDAHRRMLRRNLLYTALTRFSKLAVVVGRRSAVDRAVADAREQVRCTTLGERIRRTSSLLGSPRGS